MRWMMSAALTTLVVACNSPGNTLVVDLRTDLAPGVEFDAVRVERLEGDAAGLFRLHAADADLDYVAGARVSELEVPSGTASLRVAVLRAGGVVVERPVLVEVAGATAVTVVVSRDCRGVSCPDAGDDPSETACLAGNCVEPSCVEELPETCEGICTNDAECPAPAAACARAVCTTSGACLASPIVGECAAAEYCAPETGCAPRSGGTDASCTDGVCTCPPGETCAFDCAAGGCNVSCGADSVCTVTCPAGGCDVHCDMGAQCDLECPGGGCGMLCDPGSSCSTVCADADCFISCLRGANCGAMCGSGMRPDCAMQSCGAGLCPMQCAGGQCSVNFIG